MATVFDPLNEELRQIIRQRIRMISSLLHDYEPLVNSYVSDFFVSELWNVIPKCWWEFLSHLPPEELAYLISPTATSPSSVWPLSLLGFRAAIRCLALPRQAADVKHWLPFHSHGPDHDNNSGKSNSDTTENGELSSSSSDNTCPSDIGVDKYTCRNKCGTDFCSCGPDDIPVEGGQTLLLEHCYRRHVKPKKQHEILKMAQVISDVCAALGLGRVVDVGAGQGHLSRLLAFGHGYNVTTIEAAGGHAPKAQQFDNEVIRDILLGRLLKKKMKKDHEPGGTSSKAATSNPVHIIGKVDPQVSVADFLSILSQSTWNRSRKDPHATVNSLKELSSFVFSNHQDYVPSSLNGVHMNQVYKTSDSCTGFSIKDQCGIELEPIYHKSKCDCVCTRSAAALRDDGGLPWDIASGFGEGTVNLSPAGDLNINPKQVSHKENTKYQHIGGEECPKHQHIEEEECPKHQHIGGEECPKHQHIEEEECPKHQHIEGEQCPKHQHIEGEQCPKHQLIEGKECPKHQHIEGEECPKHQHIAGEECPKHQHIEGEECRKHQHIDGEECPKHQHIEGEECPKHQHIEGEECPKHQHIEGEECPKHQHIEGEEFPRFALTGLHTCGDLAATLLRVFVECPQASALALVGCCYMKMTRQGSTEEGKPCAYPLSEFVKQLQWQSLTWEALEMACHFIEEYHQRLRDNPPSLRAHVYRCALQEIIQEKDPTMIHGSVKLTLKKTHELPFRQYAEKALKRLHLDGHVSAEQLARAERRLGLWHHVVAFYTLRLAMAPLVETLILLDRTLYLMEQGVSGCLAPVFDPALSPRNFLLLAWKAPHP